MRHVTLAAFALVWLGGISVLATPQAPIHARAEGVVVDVAVTDGRKPVTTLTRDDFELRDTGVVQPLLDVSRERLPLDVTLTIDVSGSMTPEKRAVVERAVAQVSRVLGPDDRGSVVTFASRITERKPLEAPPLTIDLSSVGGGSAVRDALLLALVMPPVPNRRQLGLFMSDGADTTSYFDVQTAAETARHTSGQMAVVVVQGRRTVDRPSATMLGLFHAITSETGGEMIYLDEGDDLSKAFLTAIENFRTSYVLRYSPTGVPAPGWHDIAVTVKSKKYQVRARRGYTSLPR